MNAADTAWMLISTALVLMMTPALGFFYAGMVRAKNALNTLMMSFAPLGFVGLAWPLITYSIAFSPGSRWAGGTGYALLHGVTLAPQGTIPHLLFMAYQGTFAIITAALISGAIVERMRFGAYVVFVTVWSMLVYAPLAHWVWGGGWLATLGALDFAGGTVVHINAAVAAVVVATVVGARTDYGRKALIPQNVPFTLLGTGLLWLGWFGFNGGSALGANETAVLAFVNTMFAPMATLFVWMLIDLLRTKKVTAIGAATAIVVGLVAVTPAAGFVTTLSAMLIGGIAAVPSYYALLWRARTRLDDSLDVFAAHGVGGLVGALLTGVLAGKVGGLRQLGIQAIAVVATVVYSAVATFVILKLISLVISLRATPKEQGIGLDVTQHGEEAYSRGDGAILVLPEGATR
ncbi:MAG: ammonium transporter [Thermoanaerobaculia bacterium]